MIELNDPSDVLAGDVQVEHTSALEFEFDDFVLRREMHHFEIQFESSEGEEIIIVEREDFVDGKLHFDIDGKPCVLMMLILVGSPIAWQVLNIVSCLTTEVIFGFAEIPAAIAIAGRLLASLKFTSPSR